jgi:outer membrane protein TolC
MHIRSWLFLLLVLCSGCQSHIPVTLPALACQPKQAVVIDPWWQEFNDSALIDLLQQAQACNLDLEQKALEIQRYRLDSQQGEAQWQSSLSARSGQPLKQGPLSRQRGGEMSFAVAYELDLWQRQARSHDVAAWLAVAGMQQLRALRLSLDADVAIAHWQRQAQQARWQLARDNHQIRLQLREYTRQGVQTGALAPRELLLRSQEVIAAEQHLARLSRQQEETGLYLARLLERSDAPGIGSVWIPHASQPVLVSPLPATLLARRPDLAALAARLQSFYAAEQVAQAAFMPQLSLSGKLGAASPALGQLLAQPVASVLATLSLPFLDWHNLALARGRAQIDYQAAALDYRRQALQALREAADALSWREQLQQNNRRLQQTLQLMQRREREAGLRVRHGDDTVATLYQARLQHNQTRDALISVQLDQRINLALLYKVLGGGYG